MDIREYIKNNLLIFDGGMGTYYAQKNSSAMDRCELANVRRNDLIYGIHREYIEAGCKAVKTNTFGANRPAFDGDEETVREIIQKGYETACRAAGNDVFVFADIGPVEITGETDISEEYKFVADIFINCGAKNFLFETMSGDEGLKETAEYIKSKAPDAYIITSFAVQPDGYTRDGHYGRELFENVKKSGCIDAVGVNCISGPYHMLNYIKGLDIEGITLSVMPNAGYPTVINNRTLFNSSPEYFAEIMADIVKCGAGIIGGCCGTTPEYIRQTVETAASAAGSVKELTAKAENKDERAETNNTLWDKLEKGERVIAVELDPPYDANAEKFILNAKKLKETGIDIMTIADCPVGHARVDSSLLACKIKRETGLDTLPHITCRDRNLNATKALLLGLNIEGINNVLLVTGDPIPTAERDEVKSVFNFNSRILARYVSNLNETVFTSPFCICGALNVNAPNFDIQLRIAKEKVENGVKVFLTQPVMTERGLSNLKRAYNELNAKILGGVIPVMSYKNACFMDNEISGIDVDEKIIELYKGKSKEESEKLAVDISCEIIGNMEPYCHGLYIITPFSRADIVCRIIERIRKDKRL